MTPDQNDWLDAAIGALNLIADIAEGSTTANSLPNIARIARAPLAFNAPAGTADPALIERAAVWVEKYKSYSAGLERAAVWVEKRQRDYVTEHGSTDPSTGTVEFPGNGDEYVYELEEIVDGIRALKESVTR